MSSTFATSCQWVVTQYRGRSLFAQMDPSVVIGQTTEMRKKKDLPSFFSHIHPVPPGSLAYKYGVDSFLSFFLSTMFLQHWSSKNRKARQSSLPLPVENDRTRTDASMAAPIHALPGRTQKHTNYHLQILVSARLIDTSSPPTPLLICVKFVSILPDLCRGRSHSLEDTCSR